MPAAPLGTIQTTWYHVPTRSRLYSQRRPNYTWLELVDRATPTAARPLNTSRRGPYGLRYVLTACVLRHPVAYLRNLVLSNSAHCVLRIAYCALETHKTCCEQPENRPFECSCVLRIAYCASVHRRALTDAAYCALRIRISRRTLQMHTPDAPDAHSRHTLQTLQTHTPSHGLARSLRDNSIGPTGAKRPWPMLLHRARRC